MASDEGESAVFNAAFPLQHTANQLLQLSPTYLFCTESILCVWVVEDLLQESRPWLCSQLSAEHHLVGLAL